MAAKNGFFNSVKQAGGTGDRLYNAEDLSFFYDMFFTNGIACANNEMHDMFKVDITNGSYSVKITEGNCIIGGKWHRGKGETNVTLRMNTSHVVSSGMSRIDAVCIKKDDTNRTFSFYIKEGEEANSPVPPSIDTDTELCFAYYTVSSSYTVDYDSIVDTRHDKNYSGCAQIKLDKPAYDAEINEYIEKIFYIANGVNDNIVLSNLVQDYLAIEKQKDLEIKIVGNVGVTGYFAGAGTNDDPHVIFAIAGYDNKTTNVNTTENTNKVVVDFADSAPILYQDSVTSANYKIVFAGNANIKNIKINVKAKISTAIFGFRYKECYVKDSYIKLENENGATYVSMTTGEFENSDLIAISKTNTARVLNVSSKILTQNVGRRACRATKCRMLAATGTSINQIATSIYINTNESAVAIIKDCEIYKTADATMKTSNAYQVLGGTCIMQDNLLEVAGTAYTPADNINTVSITNNLIFDSLATKKPDNYYFN